MPGYDPFATPTGAQHDQVMPNPTPVTSALGAIAAPVQQALAQQQQRLSRDAYKQAIGNWRAARPDQHGERRDWRDTRPTRWDAGQWSPSPQPTPPTVAPGEPSPTGQHPLNPGNFEGQFPSAPGQVGIGQPAAWAPPTGWTPPANWDGTRPTLPTDGSAPPGWTPPAGWHANPPPQGIAVGEYNPAQPQRMDWRARPPLGA